MEKFLALLLFFLTAEDTEEYTEF